MSTQPSEYICPRCQEIHEAPSRFCGHCGASMDPGAHAPDHVSWTDAAESASTLPSRRSSDRNDPWLGKLVDNRYRVLEAIGRGGMGVVYKVEHQRMGKIAAMKVLHREYAGDEDVVGRFRREAEAVSRLTHPNTVQVFDFGTANGALYLIMEYVRGRDLATLVKRDGPLPFSRAAPLLVQICGALAEAHALGVIHRDLKPENVLVTRTLRGRDFIKVLDFGLAKLTEREERAEVTDRGSIVGTPYYMSPEQIRGEDIDDRTDVYAMGALMYRILTGEHAFAAKTPVGVLTQHLTTQLVLPSKRVRTLDIPDQVDRIVAKAMAKKREGRYNAISELQDDLERTFFEFCEPSSASFAAPEMSSIAPKPRAADLGKALDDSDEIDYGLDTSVRLRRSDLDAFESSIKRRRIARLILVPLVLAAITAAAFYLVALRPEAPRRAEREPNNELYEATLIAPSAPVTGFLGKRISKSQPDRDYYRIGPLAPLEPGGEWVVTAHVESLPNIDIEMSLFDATGNLLTRVSEGGIGNDEWVRRLRILGPIHIMVTQSLPVGTTLPTENVSDTYALRVDVEPVQGDRETEPNESPSDAMTLVTDQPISGHLDRRSDVDTFRFDGPDGTYTVIIGGASNVPLLWQTGSAAASESRRAEIALTRGVLLRLSRGDRDLPEGQKLPGADSPYTLTIAK